MMDKDQDRAVAMQRLVDYFAGKGVTLTTCDEPHLKAILAGFASPQEMEVFEQRARDIGVYRLALEDVDSISFGTVMDKTLKAAPLARTSDRDEAERLTEALAIEHKWPMVAVDGNGRQLFEYDEPRQECSVYRTVGAVREQPLQRLTPQTVEDYSLEEYGAPNLRIAAGALNASLQEFRKNGTHAGDQLVIAHEHDNPVVRYAVTI